MRLFFISIIFLLPFVRVHAQKFYSQGSIGCNLPAASQNITSNIHTGLTETTNENVRGSFAKGMASYLKAGYFFGKNLSLEAGVSYLVGGKYKGTYEKDTSFNNTIRLSANIMNATPALKMVANEKKLQLYLKLGALIRIAGKITAESRGYDYQTKISTVSTWNYSHGFSIGAFSAIGLEHKIANNLNIFAEFHLCVQSWAPKKGKLKSYAVNGVDQLDNLKPAQKEIEYSQNYTNAPKNYTIWSPSQQLKQYHNFSAIGLNVGLTYFFVKKSNNGTFPEH